MIAYLVAQRTREIGIRMAMGAVPREILGMVLRQGVGLAGLGIAAGVVGALAAGRLLTGLLFEIGPADPVTYATTVLTLALVAVLASFIPALRATRVDPVDALRTE